MATTISFEDAGEIRMPGMLPCLACGYPISEDVYVRNFGACGDCMMDAEEEENKYRYGYDPMDDWLG